MLKMASGTYIEKISVKTGEKIMISFLQYFITEICSFSENYPPIIENNIESYKNFILGKQRSIWYFPNKLHQSFLCSELEFLLWIGCRYDESCSKIETMAKVNLSPWRLWWRKIYSCGAHGEGSSIVVDTENFNCPRLSPRGNELSHILKMVSQTLIFLIPVKKIEEIHGQFLKLHTLEMRQFL